LHKSPMGGMQYGGATDLGSAFVMSHGQGHMWAGHMQERL